MEIINGLLADLPPEQTDATAVAIAHADILDSVFAYQWFEAGEALRMLYPVKGSQTACRQTYEGLSARTTGSGATMRDFRPCNA